MGTWTWSLELMTNCDIVMFNHIWPETSFELFPGEQTQDDFFASKVSLSLSGGPFLLSPVNEVPVCNERSVENPFSICV